MKRIYTGMPKRTLDVTASSLMLVILSPLLALLWVLVRVKLGSPVLFRQLRPGRFGVPFNICKLRTMTGARDANGETMPDSARLTKFGEFLRRTSLDELPELWNVLRGDMSLVGPRPLLLAYLDRYTPEQMRRHEVMPGITGWAQINGRNELSWPEKFDLDLWYVDHWSLKLDFYILGKTLWQVVKRDGISQPGHATMTEFMGSPTQSRRDG
jgi:sugar transferase EpsL